MFEAIAQPERRQVSNESPSTGTILHEGQQVDGSSWGTSYDVRVRLQERGIMDRHNLSDAAVHATLAVGSWKMEVRASTLKSLELKPAVTTPDTDLP